ncbi:transposase [Caballeronia udeis]|uniref:transposase n=1 Tax=Caballeronia udeis TaxID=1232866 RepID=UPI00384CB848
MQYKDKSSNGRGVEGRYKRPNFPMEFKRQLAEQSFEPGACVALIARQNDVNANRLFSCTPHSLETETHNFANLASS